MDRRKLYTAFNGGPKPGRHAPSPRQGQLTHLWENHHRMLRLALTGMTAKDIACELDCAPQTVSNCLNSALGQRMLEEMRGAVNKEAVDTASRLREMNAKALEVLSEILDDADAPRSLRAKVAMDNLSRTGFAPQINVRGTMDHRVFGPDDVERIKLVAIQAAARQGSLILPSLTDESSDVQDVCFSELEAVS
jgi:hypothetical protein